MQSTTPLNAYKGLFDSLRLVAVETNRRFVLAAADASGAAGEVVAGLAAYIESLGFRTLRAELSLVQGRPILRRCREQSLESLRDIGIEFDGDLTPLDLSTAAAQAEVAEWLAAASRVADIVLIEGCPLADSVDAALLARSCAGLVLVAHAGVTERTTLATAAERARTAGCKTVGIVLYGSKNPLPAWARHLLERPRLQSSSLEEE
jgi:Mrp family chromosome partitioning ATPase